MTRKGTRFSAPLQSIARLQRFLRTTPLACLALGELCGVEGRVVKKNELVASQAMLLPVLVEQHEKLEHAACFANIYTYMQQEENKQKLKNRKYLLPYLRELSVSPLKVFLSARTSNNTTNSTKQETNK